MGAGRLASIIEEIQRAPRAGGYATVVDASGGELRLAEIEELGLACGNAVPPRGRNVPWIRHNESLVVAVHRQNQWFPQKMRPRAMPAWAPDVYAGLIPGFDNGQFANTGASGCGADAAGNAWALVCRWAGQTFELHLCGAHARDLSVWQSKWSRSFAPYDDVDDWNGGPGRGMPCLLVDGEDLWVWWHRDLAWANEHTASGIMQVVHGAIDLANATVAMGGVVDLDLPYIEGFAPGRTPAYSAMSIDPDGQIWVITTPREYCPTAQLILLYGDELPEGSLHYAISPVSAESEMGPAGLAAMKYGSGEGISTLSALTNPGCDLVSVGSGGLLAGWYGFGMTHWSPVSGESGPWTGVQAWVLVGNGSSVTVRTPDPPMPNGGVRVYASYSPPGAPWPPWSYWEKAGPFRVAEGSAPDQIEFTISSFGGGAAPPSVSTLNARRVRVSDIGQGPPGTSSRRVYRSGPGETAFGLVHTIGDNADGASWDDAMASAGAAPPHPPAGPFYSSVAVGRAGIREIAAVEWTTMRGWAPNDTLGDHCAIAGLNDGRALAMWQDGAGAIAARYSGTSGWQSEFVLDSQPGRQCDPGSILLDFEHGIHIAWHSWVREIGDPDAWHYCWACVREGQLVVTPSIPVYDLADGSLYSTVPRLSRHELEEIAVLTGMGHGGIGRVFNLDDLGDWVWPAGPDTPGGAGSWWQYTAPAQARSLPLWGAFLDGDESLGVVLWWPS